MDVPWKHGERPSFASIKVWEPFHRDSQCNDYLGTNLMAYLECIETVLGSELWLWMPTSMILQARWLIWARWRTTPF